jgi:hypothetical protein
LSREKGCLLSIFTLDSNLSIIYTVSQCNDIKIDFSLSPLILKGNPYSKLAGGGIEMDRKNQPLVSKEMIYVCLGFIGLILLLMVLGSTQWGFKEMFQLWLSGFTSLF